MKCTLYSLLLISGMTITACGNNKSSKPTMDADTSKMKGDTADQFNQSNGIQHDSMNRPLDSSYNDSIIRKMRKR